jgi:hypothetical protein
MKKLSIGELPVYRAAPPNVRDNLLLVDGQDGAKNLSVGVGVYNKGQASEFHTHVESEEVMIYLKGQGLMRMEDGTEVVLSPSCRRTSLTGSSTRATANSSSSSSTRRWDRRRASASGTLCPVSAFSLMIWFSSQSVQVMSTQEGKQE